MFVETKNKLHTSIITIIIIILFLQL